MPRPANPLTKYQQGTASPLDRIEHFLAYWADQTPQADAALDAGQCLSYADLAERVYAAAHVLQANGVRDGDVIAVLAPPSIDFLILFLATHQCGATWLGLNPKYTRHELADVLCDAKPSLVIARQVMAGRHYGEDLADVAALAEMADSQFFWLGEAQDPGNFPAFAPQPLSAEAQRQMRTRPAPANAIAALVYTSGSTGKPKAACLSHQALIKGAQVRSRVWKVTPFRTINNLPINHIGCLGDLVCTCLVSGGAQVFLEKFSAAGTLDAIERHRLTFWYQAPAMFQMCLDDPRAATMDWSHLQAAIWSGGRASDALIDAMARVAKKLAVDYSMTESVGAVTLSELTDDLTSLRQSVGWPDPDRTLRLVDPDTAAPVAAGEVGEVQIKDPWMFSGYRKPQANEGAFSADGWFKTGDLAVENPDGSWRIAGRCKEMFKSGGYNVYPREVEQVLESHPDVRQVAVVDVPDPLYGEVGVAFVALHGAGTDDSTLLHYCRERLANYKIPKRLVFMETLPMLPIGKVDKAALKVQAKGLGQPLAV